jgi:hypothetical protein
MDEDNSQHMDTLSRRKLLERSCLGFGSLVLADLLKADTNPASAVPI